MFLICLDSFNLQMNVSNHDDLIVNFFTLLSTHKHTHTLDISGTGIAGDGVKIGDQDCKVSPLHFTLK